MSKNTIVEPKYKYRIKHYFDSIPYKHRTVSRMYLARRLNVSVETIRQWMYAHINEDRKIPGEHLVVIADFFSKVLVEPITIEDLFSKAINKVDLEDFEKESTKKTA